RGGGGGGEGGRLGGGGQVDWHRTGRGGRLEGPPRAEQGGRRRPGRSTIVGPVLRNRDQQAAVRRSGRHGQVRTGRYRLRTAQRLRVVRFMAGQAARRRLPRLEKARQRRPVDTSPPPRQRHIRTN